MTDNTFKIGEVFKDPGTWDLTKQAKPAFVRVTRLPHGRFPYGEEYEGVYITGERKGRLGLFHPKTQMVKLQPENQQSVGHQRNHPEDASEQLFPIKKLGSPVFNLSFDSRDGRVNITQGSGIGGVEKVSHYQGDFSDRKAFENEADYVQRVLRSFAIAFMAHRQAVKNYQEKGKTLTESKTEARVGCGKAQAYEIETPEIGDRVVISPAFRGTKRLIGKEGYLDRNANGGLEFEYEVVLDDASYVPVDLEEVDLVERF